MIVQTPAGPTDTKSGEILDFSSLKRRPMKRPVYRSPRRPVMSDRDFALAIILGGIVALGALRVIG
jgi:hypothetical protein